LLKLGFGLSRSPDEAMNHDQQDLTLNRPDPSPRPFQSQRRSTEVGSIDSSFGKVPTASSRPGLDASDALRRLEAAIASGNSRDRQTAAALKRFIATGAMAELRNLDRRDVEALAEYLAGQMSREEMGAVLERLLGFPANQLIGQEDPKATLVGIYDAVAGNHVEDVRPSVLMVTDQTSPNGEIIGQTHELPAGSQKVYAVFENDRALQGLDQVLAIWRDPNDDSMVFTEFEPIRRGSAYNYVWLEVATGWPQGRYQVELFHPEAQSLLLASESFSVR